MRLFQMLVSMSAFRCLKDYSKALALALCRERAFTRAQMQRFVKPAHGYHVLISDLEPLPEA
jgi:hypothetical protein